MAKPRKVEESPGTYSAAPKRAGKSSAQSGVRYADEKAFRKSAEKVLKTHKELFRRLAQ